MACLMSREMLREEVIIYFDGVSQRKSHSQWETFRHGDDQNGHTDNQKLDKVVKVLVLPWLLFFNERLDAESNDQNDDRQDGDG